MSLRVREEVAFTSLKLAYLLPHAHLHLHMNQERLPLAPSQAQH